MYFDAKKVDFIAFVVMVDIGSCLLCNFSKWQTRVCETKFETFSTKSASKRKKGWKSKKLKVYEFWKVEKIAKQEEKQENTKM